MVNILPQQKARCCYVLLSVWIVVMIIGVYRYLEFGTADKQYKSSYADNTYSFSVRNGSTAFYRKYGKLYKSCNTLHTLNLGTEGEINGNYTLEGVLILFRHGDRGPLNHIRNMFSIYCGFSNTSDTELYNNYTSVLSSYWSSQSNPFQFLHPYFAHPPLPNPTYCEIAQLTALGMQQLLKLGSLFKSVYYTMLVKNSSLLNGNITVYSTNYRRTLLSLSSFLYGFLPSEDLYKVNFQVAYSFFYCFDDCACHSAEDFKKAYSMQNSKRLKSHPAILKLTKEVSSFVFTSADPSILKDPYSLKDALLAYVCHNSTLPCLFSNCVEMSDVTRLFSYINWDTQQYVKDHNMRKYAILKSYGLVKNIVSHLLKIVSENKSKVVIYSAHDKTIQFLLISFGILIDEAAFPKYASRVVIEVYRDINGKNNASGSLVTEYFFRLVFNGRDVTNRVKFCKKNFRKQISANNKKLYLCSIESVVRFLHDDYFTSFNATNFKDACEYKL